MSHLQPSGYRRAGIVILGIALVACGDPTNLTRPKLQPNSARHLVSSVNGSTISILDDDGTSYTLDVPAQEIRVSTGVVIHLPPEQMPDYANGFMNIVVGDSLANQIGAAPPPEAGDGHGGPCGWNPCDSRPSPSVGLNRVAGQSAPAAVQPLGLRPSKTILGLNSAPSLDEIIADSGPFSCAEIAENIMVSQYVYRGSRPTVLGVIKGGIAAALAGYLPGVTEIEPLAWMIAVGADINTAMVGNMHDLLTLRINVAMYRMNYCSQTYYSSGPLPSFDLGGGLTYDCHSEYQTIQLAAGSWSGWVSVCAYKMQ
jgi:hypothetical protein